MYTFALTLLLILVCIFLVCKSSSIKYGRWIKCSGRKSNNSIEVIDNNLISRIKTFEYVNDLKSEYIKIFNRRTEKIDYSQLRPGSTVFYIDDPFQSTDESISQSLGKHPNISLFIADDLIDKKLNDNTFLWPIGFESRMIENPNLMKLYSKLLHESDTNKRKLIASCNAHLNTYNQPASGIRADRVDMINELRGTDSRIDFWDGRKSREDCLISMTEHIAELCPEGNGIDTHRFYEVFGLGEIPIVRLGLYNPVHSTFPGTITVSNWKDVMNIDLADIKQSMNHEKRLEMLKIGSWLYKALRCRCRILTFFTGNYCDEWKNLMLSLQKNNLLDLVIVYVLDEHAFKCANVFDLEIRYTFMQGHKSGDFGGKEFNNLMMLKLKLIQETMQEGFFIFYLDTDIVVKKNFVLDYFSLPPKTLYIQSDHNHFESEINIHEHNKCAGCMFFTPSDASGKIISDAIEYFPYCNSMDDQCAINHVLNTNHDIEFDILDQKKYINGARYFDSTHDDGFDDDIFLIHNNWIQGLDNKIERFKKHNLWYVSSIESLPPLPSS